MQSFATYRRRPLSETGREDEGAPARKLVGLSVRESKGALSRIMGCPIAGLVSLYGKLGAPAGRLAGGGEVGEPVRPADRKLVRIAEGGRWACNRESGGLPGRRAYGAPQSTNR